MTDPKATEVILKPCLECAKDTAEMQYHCGVHYVECKSCGHQSELGWLETEVIAAWNTRPTIEGHADAILRASGSALKNYSIPATRRAILDAVLACWQMGHDDGLADCDCRDWKRQPPKVKALVEAVARKAMAQWPFARTGVTNPVNGSAPYSWVRFLDQVKTFHDGEFTIERHRTAGTEKAAAYAQAINDAAFELAKRAALAAFEGME